MFLETFKKFWKIIDEDHEDLHVFLNSGKLPADLYMTFIAVVVAFPADLSALPADSRGSACMHAPRARSKRPRLVARHGHF